MKKLLCLALAAVLCLALAAGVVAEDNWKIAILTGTTSQGEEEFRAAERAVATYGAEHVITDTYPDNFMAETETTISKLLAFASDPDVKAIVDTLPEATALLRVEHDIQAAWNSSVDDIYMGNRMGL